jgi:hypothetical protein
MVFWQAMKLPSPHHLSISPVECLESLLALSSCISSPRPAEDGLNLEEYLPIPNDLGNQSPSKQMLLELEIVDPWQNMQVMPDFH